jgi:uncharacterized protein YcfL
MRLSSFAVLGSVLLASCSSPPDVIVVDSAGAPIVGAEVEPVTASMNLKTVLTAASGEAQLGGSIQDVQWINVRKAGYAPQFSIDFKESMPTCVVLKP